MNAKQALKAVRQRLEDLEITVQRATSDIKRYNECIDGIIRGKSPCEWCEDEKECQLEAHNLKKGCGLWMLSYEEDDHGQDTAIDTGAAGGPGGGSCGAGTGGPEVQAYV